MPYRAIPCPALPNHASNAIPSRALPRLNATRPASTATPRLAPPYLALGPVKVTAAFQDHKEIDQAGSRTWMGRKHSSCELHRP